MDKMASESVPKYMAAFDKLLGDKEYFLKQVGQVAQYLVVKKRRLVPRKNLSLTA